MRYFIPSARRQIRRDYGHRLCSWSASTAMPRDALTSLVSLSQALAIRIPVTLPGNRPMTVPPQPAKAVVHWPQRDFQPIEERFA
jgi:myo-inositol catabolism protein IolC